MHKRYSFGRALWVATIAATTVFLILGEPSVRADSAEAWGYNLYGQLGNGSTTNSKTPVAVNGMADRVTAIAGGGFHSLAIQNGGVYAWGNDGVGELGNGSTTTSSTPVAVSGMGNGVTAIAAGF